MSGVRSQSITTPIKPVQTSIILESNPSVILNKKTLRNYTPRESSCLLRQFEEERLYSGVRDKRLGLDVEGCVSPQFSSLTSRKSKSSVGGKMTREIDMDTCNSNVSAWSAASFDWHSGSCVSKNQGSSDRSVNKNMSPVSPVRSAPAGASSPGVTQTSLHDTRPSNREQRKSEMDHLKHDDDDDGLGNLRKLLKEGKIAGLHDKPPAFTPPSPPSKTSSQQTKMINKKQKAPSSPPASTKPSENKNKKHEKRLAPPPPSHDQFNTPTPNDTVQFLGGRRVHSVENICSDFSNHVIKDPRSNKVGKEANEQLKRSTSIHANNAKGRHSTQLKLSSSRASVNNYSFMMHFTIYTLYFSEYLGKSQPKDSLAQLIADSTEKKFRFNSLFKGIWKKKQYSLDDC